MKKAVILLSVLIVALSLCACHEHDWEKATCKDPKTCADCDATEGKIADHSWEAATCLAPKTCSVCGKTEGSATAHSWKKATCTEPKTCSNCGKTEGSPANHRWIEATCNNPKTCLACGMTEGSVNAHNWQEATCTQPKTCTYCGITEGTVIPHSWQNVTCTAPKTCSFCGKTEGSALGHSWENVNVYTKQCKTCGAKEIDQSKLPVKLDSLTPCSGDNYHSDKYGKDIYGNEFSEGLFLRFGVGINYNKTCNTEYVLNKAYKKFTTTVMVSSSSKDTFESKLKIYVDNVLVYDSNTINKKTQPINIEIDISNAAFIELEAIRIDGSGDIMLADPMLHH